MTGGVIVINNCPRPARGLARGDLKESHFMRHDMSCIMSPGLLYQVFCRIMCVILTLNHQNWILGT